MGHLTTKGEYFALQQRLDMHPIGAPMHKELIALLEELYSPEECRVAAAMPLRFASGRTIAGNAKLDEKTTEQILQTLVRKGLVVDLPKPSGKTVYYLNPTLLGFFEFTMMRVRDDIDQKKVAQHLWNYIHEDPDKAVFNMIGKGDTFIARPLVHEDVLEPDVFSEVLDYEKASEVIANAGFWGEGLCYCRHVKRHLDEGCDKPEDHCLSLGFGAQYLVNSGHAKKIDKQRALDVLANARELDLVQMCDNAKKRPLFICNCCKCCCEMLDGLRTIPHSGKVVTSNYMAVIDDDVCNGCGKCVKACPVNVIELVAAEPTDQAPKRRKKAAVNTELCLGCGICHRNCTFNAIALKPIGQRTYTPDTTTEKLLMMAVEQGKLQHMIFDNQNKISHRALGSILSGILKLPPAKQLLARKQLRSKFVNMMLDTLSMTKESWIKKI